MNKKKIVLVLIGLIFIGLIFVFFSTSNWKTYTRSDEGFSFQYPKEWGDINYRQDPAGGNIELVTITFSKNPMINIIFSTKDYQPWKGTAYTGTDSVEDAYSLFLSNYMLNYKTPTQYISVAGVPEKGLLSTYVFLPATTAQDNISGINFYLQLPNKPYTGLLVTEGLNDNINSSIPATDQDKIKAQNFIDSVQNGTVDTSTLDSIALFKKFVGTFVFK
jgi:hypothetical protein